MLYMMGPIDCSPQKASQGSEMLALSLGCRGNPGSRRRSALLYKPHDKWSGTITDYGYFVHTFLPNRREPMLATT